MLSTTCHVWLTISTIKTIPDSLLMDDDLWKDSAQWEIIILNFELIIKDL